MWVMLASDWNAILDPDWDRMKKFSEFIGKLGMVSKWASKKDRIDLDRYMQLR